MHVVDLRADDESAIHQVAALLVEGFATNWPEAWPDLDSAVEEVRESFAAGRISRVARDEDGTVLGWISGISQYRGHVWELHPLVVRVSNQGKGIGRALVADLEERVKERGGLTITLDSIAPRFVVQDMEQALAFYGQLGFAPTYQDEAFAIITRDGIDLHLNASSEPPKGRSVCWIGIFTVDLPALLRYTIFR